MDPGGFRHARRCLAPRATVDVPPEDPGDAAWHALGNRRTDPMPPAANDRREAVWTPGHSPDTFFTTRRANADERTISRSDHAARRAVGRRSGDPLGDYVGSLARLGHPEMGVLGTASRSESPSARASPRAHRAPRTAVLDILARDGAQSAGDVRAPHVTRRERTFDRLASPPPIAVSETLAHCAFASPRQRRAQR